MGLIVPKPKRKNLTNHTPQELICWAHHLQGKPLQETADLLGCTVGTVAMRRDRVREFMGKSFDLQDYRQPLHQMYELWLKSASGLLQGGDSAFTNAMGKGLGYFNEKVELDISDNTMSDEELDAKIEAKLLKAGGIEKEKIEESEK